MKPIMKVRLLDGKQKLRLVKTVNVFDKFNIGTPIVYKFNEGIA